MKKFIKGAFELDENVIDLVAHEEKHKIALEEIVEWANNAGVAILFGTSEDNTYLCEYKIVGKTVAFCKGLASELKALLKDEFPKTKMVWQGTGDCW